MELPSITSLSEPGSDHGQPQSTNISRGDGDDDSTLSATQLGSHSFLIPVRLSPLPTSLSASKKRKISFSSRTAKSRKTSVQTSATLASNASDVLELQDSDELPDASQLLSKVTVPQKPKAKQTARRMSHQRASFFKPKRTLGQPELETIVLDSSDDEGTVPVATTSQLKPVPAPELIEISDTDSDSAPPARVFPSQTLSPRFAANVGAPARDAISPITPPVELLPPLPPSSPDTGPPTGDRLVSPLAHAPFTTSGTPLDKSTHRTPQGTQGGSGSESGSSGIGLVETNVVLPQPNELGFVLDSGASSSDGNTSLPQGGAPRPASPSDRGGRLSIHSPRHNAPIGSSPSHGSLSHSAALTELDLEDIVANVSLHDTTLNALTDRVLAQTAAAVGSIVLEDESEREHSSSNDSRSLGIISASSGGTVWHRCNVPECTSQFATRGQLQTHMGRDHGLRLAQQSQRTKLEKRKLTTTPKALLKQHTPSSTSEKQPQVASDSADASPSSDRYVERTNTVGFDPFIRTLSERGVSSSPELCNDANNSSDGSPSPTQTPVPQALKMRPAHPHNCPSVPDSPSTHLSPSKQLAQKKNEVVIPGEPIETWRVDLVNSMPESYRASPSVRLVFEGFMDQAMRENEPCAPQIRVDNKVDNQPCPPWEFVYSNRVLYGENVPRPDRDALQGCDCLGPCNPNDKNCACVRKQEAFFAGSETLSDFEGFAFNKDGTIRFHSGAVFGCNSKCACDLECQNKVWQQGRKHEVVLRKTKEKGWGVFAKEPIPAGSYLGVYTGELLTEGVADKRANVYDEFGRTYVLGIDFQHTEVNSGAPNYRVDAFHAGNFTRFLNHSCRPNLCLSALYVEDPDIRKPWLGLFTEQDIRAGDELTFSYTGMDVNDPEDRAKAEKQKKASASGKLKRGKVFEQCLCGAEGCFGILFK